MVGEDKLGVPINKTPQVSPTKKRSDDELSILKRQRGTLKGRLTQFQNYLDLFTDTSPSTLQIKEIKFRMQACQDQFKQFNDIQCKVDFLSSESDADSNNEYVQTFESSYFHALAQAESLVESVETGDKCTNIAKNSGFRSLPKIKLPTFSGKFDDWLEYKHAYVTMIHNCPDLDEIQKFHYLRSSLSGTALEVISSFEFTPTNYVHAWELLENRFHNTRLLVQNHIKALFQMSSLKQESSSQIRKLIDTVLRNIRSLTSLGEPTSTWDTIIIYLVQSKLDATTEREWEVEKGTIHASSDNKLKLDDILSFLKKKADMLDSISSSQNKPQKSQNDSKGHSQKNHASLSSYVSTSESGAKSNPKRKGFTCQLCNGEHAIYTCFKFLNMQIKDRIKVVDDKKLCRNCLRAGHSLSDCIFGPCKQCSNKHNSLLHLKSGNEESAAESSSQTAPSTALHSLSVGSVGTYHGSVNECARNGGDSFTPCNVLQPVLLCTALVEVADSNNHFHTARALLDNGSQHCFISDKLQKRINASLIQSTIQISGVAQSVTQSNHSCELLMRSKINDYSAKVKCFVLKRITNSLPTTSIDPELIRIPDNVYLADPTYNIPSEIDLLIGADLFWEILDGTRIRLVNGPFLQNSKLGWLLSGPLCVSKSLDSNSKVHCNFNQTLGLGTGLDEQLKRFWELENVPQVDNVLSKDEQFCEELFTTTTKRESEGRFSVRIPLKESPEALGDSYNLAKNRFLSLERKLERLPDYKRMYSDFMSEYVALGHMSRVDKVEEPNYYLPHHGVFRESSSTTKLRVVFDGSAVTTSNKSLNDIQYPGPALQNDIFSILLRFRQYKYVACADVEKMFRQVLVQADQRSLQLLLWRDSPAEPLGTWSLNTVSYGTASAPYLAMRCIRQLALECSDDVIARVISQDFFVDDLCTGHDDYHELLAICEKTSQVLKSGCFPLRKWTFNADVTNESCAHTFVGEHTQNKTLGIGWQNIQDELHFTTKIDCDNKNVKLTKRIMLSVISQIYDPLGLLSPVVIIAKILIQKLWLDKVGWDSAVSEDLALTWYNFISTLACLHKLRIPRHAIGDKAQFTELHIFADASQNAYGSCAYIRSYSTDSEVTVRLLCAKSKVSPLKSLSIPKLELSSALVGARLYKKIIDSLRLTFTRVYFWTDSTIVIGWLRMSPHLLKTFIQNRVSEINELTNDAEWLHVRSKDNPADLLSRGMPLDLLIDSELWWNGPSYLQNKNHNFSNNKLLNESINLNELPELKSQSINLTCNSCPNEIIQFNKYSSFIKLKRIGAYVLRFIKNLRSTREQRETGFLSVTELNASQIMLVRLAQMHSFPDAYNNLLNNLPVKTNSKSTNCILGLNIFLDENKLIRVGGRLVNSTEFSYEKKHPLLLCSKHHLTVLIVQYEHKRLFHSGPQLLLSTLRECWWPLGARNLVRKIVRECVTCARFKGKTLQPKMGNLPSTRLDSGFPFSRTGMDLGGVFHVLNKRGRGSRLSKTYVCLFVCFLTRAVHLELVSSLSTDDFILALKRFISRRGKPDSIYSDNGTNFVGAEKEFYTFLDKNSKQIIDYTANDGIKFNFIPPYSPHFGGLWESGIRSCKYHLRRVVGNAKLTYEELSTVLAQIEAVLNSRPMSPLSPDPNDFTPLTPGHFLIGRPLTAPAAHDDLTDVPVSRLNRYHQIEQLRQHFWQRWSREYIAELQRRTKWKANQEDIRLESLVLIKDDNLPPLKWRLGRVTKVFPGTDGVSRVAEIRTAAGMIRRAFSKICPLPLEPVDSRSQD